MSSFIKPCILVQGETSINAKGLNDKEYLNS